MELAGYLICLVNRQRECGTRAHTTTTERPVSSTLRMNAMPDNYGRMNESEASPGLKKLLYPDKPFCWVCGATIESGTVCPNGVHTGKRPIFDMNILQRADERRVP